VPDVTHRRRLRVLTLLDTLRPGGAERVAATVATKLDRRRFQPIVCVSRRSSGSPLNELLAEAHVPVVALDRAHRASLLNWRLLVALLRRERIDVLHAHMFGSNVWGTLFARIAGVPVVIAHEHGSPLEEDPVRHAIDRELIGRGADVFVAVSQADRTRLIELERIPDRKVRVIPNGIVPLAKPQADVRVELGIPSRAPVIGTLTVLRPEKALDVLVEASALVARQLPELRVLIAGAGSEEVRLRALIQRRGLEQTVHLLGFRPDVADVLAAVDVAVFSSDREGSPLAVLESMAAAKAIVATSVGGIPALVQNEEHALVVPPRDATALAEAIGRLLQDRALRARIGRNAQDRQRREFDLQTMLESLEDLYEQLFATSRRGRREASARTGRLNVPTRAEQNK
jgi:glycosyltransferase involved in cell wall biosynthesis